MKNQEPTADGAIVAVNTPPRPIKKRSSMSLMRVALFMMRRQSPTKKKNPIQSEIVAAATSKKGFLRMLLGAMRPLHQPQLEDCPVAPTVPVPDKAHFYIEGPTSEPYKEVFLPPPSPCGSEGWFSSDGMNSRYCSAEDLQALDTSEENDDHATQEEADKGPNQIDLEAEEFIAKFYAQMRLQKMDSFLESKTLSVA